MHVERFGSGPRHFLGIHGWNGTAESFRKLAERLPPDVSFWALDLPGCGQSPRPRVLTAERILEELTHLSAQLPHPCTVIGNCSGAIFGLLLAQTQPQQVERLVMIDAFAAIPWYFRIFALPGGELPYWLAFANPLGRVLANLSLRSKRTDLTDLTAGFRNTDHVTTRAYLRLFLDAAALVRFEDIIAPVDLFYGERTFQSIRESIPYFQKHLPVQHVECLRGAGHLPLLEATDQICALLFAHEEYKGILCTTTHNHLPVTAR